MIPAALRDALSDRLGGPVEGGQPVYGGDINHAARFAVNGTRYFVKWSREAPASMFPAEADGLRRLSEAGEIRIPAVIALGEAEGACPAYLALEWIETDGSATDATMEDFGARLAALHRHTTSQHGLERDNFIGLLPQRNTPDPAWSAFYRDQRIRPQMEMARQRGLLPKRREDLLTRLIERLPDLLDDTAIQPALLHGDLWGGNYLVDDQGEAVLIDPAVYYGPGDDGAVRRLLAALLRGVRRDIPARSRLRRPPAALPALLYPGTPEPVRRELWRARGFAGGALRRALSGVCGRFARGTWQQRDDRRLPGGEVERYTALR